MGEKFDMAARKAIRLRAEIRSAKCDCENIEEIFLLISRMGKIENNFVMRNMGDNKMRRILKNRVEEKFE